MRRRHDPVRAQSSHVAGHRRKSLAAVEEELCAGGAAHLRDGRGREHAPEDVGNVRQRDDLDFPFFQDAREGVDVDAGLVWRERDDPENGAGPRRDELPGDDVGVVLELGDGDLVARLQELAAVFLFCFVLLFLVVVVVLVPLFGRGG